MRILFIAPAAPGISWTQEIELISRWHQLTPILGTVTQERLTTATTGARFDIIHIAAHGTSDGIQISDGTLTKDQLGQIARQVRADLVFLNACDSARLGQFLVDTGTPATIAYTVPTLDADALRTAAYYYEELAEHDGDFRVAYYRATPADGTLCWFSDGSFVDRLIKPLVSQLQTLADQFNQFRHQIGTDQKSLLRIVALAFVAILFINGIALWAIAAATTANATDLGQTIGTIPDPTVTTTDQPLPTPTAQPSATNPTTIIPTVDESSTPTRTPIPLLPTPFPTATTNPTAVPTATTAQLPITQTPTPPASPSPTALPTTTPHPVLPLTVTATPFPPATPISPLPTPILIPTNTQPTKRPRPATDTPTIAAPTPTPTPFPPALQTLIAQALQATLAAPGACTHYCPLPTP